MRPLTNKLLANGVFDIEFHGYLTNHVKHAMIALDRLQAPNERVQEYWDEYTTSTPYNLPLERVGQVDWNNVQPATIDQWKAWRGKKVRWQEQVAFVNHELETRHSGDTNKLVAHLATPELLQGMMGALTHTIIHLGWAIDAGSPWMIAEGLSYLNFAHVGIQDSKLTWNAVPEDEPMDSLLRVADTFKEQHLADTWIAKAKAAYDESFHPELVPAGFQWEFAKVVEQPHAVATQLPAWITTTKNMEDLWQSLYRATVYLYLATRDKNGNGNFVVLHLVTSLWGLEKTLGVISDERISRKAIGYYYAGLVSILSTASSGFPDKSVLVDVQTKFPANVSDGTDFDWSETIKAGIAEEEEHNIKLVYVMRQLWSRYNHWKGFSEAARSFTLTPNIGPTNAAFTQ